MLSSSFFTTPSSRLCTKIVSSGKWFSAGNIFYHIWCLYHFVRMLMPVHHFHTPIAYGWQELP